ENLVIGNAAATAQVNDTINNTTVDLSASTVLEGAVANYASADARSTVSWRTSTVHTDQGDITITNGHTTGTLVIASGNGEDVYLHAPSMTALFPYTTLFRSENLVIGNAAATAQVNDTINNTTVDLSASTVLEGAVA